MQGALIPQTAKLLFPTISVIGPIALAAPMGIVILAADPHYQGRASALICQSSHLQVPPYRKHTTLHHGHGHTLGIAVEQTKFGPIKKK